MATRRRSGGELHRRRVVRLLAGLRIQQNGHEAGLRIVPILEQHLRTSVKCNRATLGYIQSRKRASNKRVPRAVDGRNKRPAPSLQQPAQRTCGQKSRIHYYVWSIFQRNCFLPYNIAEITHDITSKCQQVRAQSKTFSRWKGGGRRLLSGAPKAKTRSPHKQLTAYSDLDSHPSPAHEYGSVCFRLFLQQGLIITRIRDQTHCAF